MLVFAKQKTEFLTAALELAKGNRQEHAGYVKAERSGLRRMRAQTCSTWSETLHSRTRKNVEPQLQTQRGLAGRAGRAID